MKRVTNQLSGDFGNGGFKIVVENMVVRDDTDIEKIAEQLYRLMQRRR